MGDVWKRFNLPALGYPFTIFALVDTNLDEFQMKWNTILATLAACPLCVDIEFTAALLKLFPAPPESNEEAWTTLHSQVCALLEEVTIVAATNSEAVENKHAISQSLFAKVRGRAKTLACAVEDSFLDVIARSYGKLQDEISKREQAKNVKVSFSRLGKRRRGSYSQPKGIFQESEDKPLQQRVEAARSRQMRKMSGLFSFQNVTVTLLLII